MMHIARIRRYGYPEPNKDAWASLAKLPRKVDNFILENCKSMEDEEIA